MLDVPESANSDEIKKAYRKLSLKYHPDKNPGKPEVVELFQKISEAYETLGDEEKRRNYDAMKNNPFARMHQGHPGHQQQEFNNINEMFANLFGGGMGGMGPMGGMFPPGANVQFFRNGVPVNMMQKPEPIVKTITITMEQVLTGCKMPIDIERWILQNGTKTTERVTMYVDIFKGIDSNEVLLLQDQGNVFNDNCKGDVKLFIKIENDSGFVRRGLDLIYDKKISLKDSLCGFSFELKYINGKFYTINNQPGNVIPPEFQKVLPNMGLARDNHVGNLIIHFHVEFPTSFELEKIDKLREIL